MCDDIRLIALHSTSNKRCSQSLCQLLMIRLIPRSHGHNHNVYVIIVYSLQSGLTINDCISLVVITLHFQLCSVHYSVLQMNEKDLCNQSGYNRNSDDFCYKFREAIVQCYCESTPCTVSKDIWDTGKSMKHTLMYILQYAKRHLSG